MTRLMLLGLAAALATPALAAGPFDGTWRIDLKTMKLSERPETYLLKDGTFSCPTCQPPFTVAADGAMHAVKDQPYFDEAAVTVVDERTMREVRRKHGRKVAEISMAVAPDNKTAVYSFSQTDSDGAPPVTGKGILDRVGKAPAGAHATSGSWRNGGYSEMSDSRTLIAFRTDGDRLAMSTPGGVSYTVPLDGSQAPVKGDPGWTTVSVRRSGPQTIVETDYRDGQPIAVQTMTVSPDGRVMSVLSQDQLRGTASSYTATKQ